ncbi:MAG: beta-mannosidase [bacterium]
MRHVMILFCLMGIMGMVATPIAAQDDALRPATRFDLNGEWQLYRPDFGRAHAIPAEVPGENFTALLKHKWISDPFVGRNELRLQTLEEIPWTYSRDFVVEEDLLKRGDVRLVFEGIDTIAEVRLNGKTLGRTTNMFRRWEFPVRDVLQAGVNELEVRFTPPAIYGRELADKGYLPTETYFDMTGAMTQMRKAAYQFGWDWAPRLVGCGIWRPVYLVAYDGPRIRYAMPRQYHQENGTSRQVRLKMDVEMDAPSAGQCQLLMRVSDPSQSRIWSGRQSIEYPAGISRQSVECTVENPELWWPRGHGEAKLYELELTVESGEAILSSEKQKIGFRTIELENEIDEIGVSFVIKVNDRPIFCKGANWIPSDSFPTRVTDEQYRRLLTDAAECNMNMIRVWGGGIYENDIFYDLCDELGILVWQDFMFACAIYPAYDYLLEDIRAEARHNVKRLMHHPSIALWCGNNECGDMPFYSFPERVDYQNAYRKIFEEELPAICDELDPQRPYWSASPNSLISEWEADHLDGDSHVWSVWHNQKPFEDYWLYDARFVSEFGFQSFPDYDTIRHYVADGIMNLTAPEVAHHQKNGGGNERILIQMLDRFLMPSSFQNFVTLSQLQQALAMQMGVEHWRRIMPTCMGTLYWQLNDCWPVTSWSSIDYFGNWKALQYFARRFYEPFHVSAVGGDGVTSVGIYVTNDIPLNEAATLDWTLQTYSGKVIARGQEAWTVQGQESRLVKTIEGSDYLAPWFLKSRETPYAPENSYLALEARCGEHVSRNVWHFDKFKNLKLPHPNIAIKQRAKNGKIVFTLTTDVFAKWVWIEAETDDGQGRFSDQYFDMNPGETREIIYDKNSTGKIAVYSLVDLYNSPDR